MNKKGFTIIELLATIIILAIVSGIATTGVLSAINTSKLKSEKVFVNKLSNLIDDYLDLVPPTQKNGPTYTFNKCKDAYCTETYSVTASQMLKSDGTQITISDLISAGVVTQNDLINPKNKKQCFNTSANPEIVIYKDSDYVYHYYVDLSDTNTNCEITAENAIIDTLPDNLKSQVGLL